MNPLTAFNDPNGFGKFLRSCVEQPAYADNLPFALATGTYDVGNKVYGGQRVTMFGWAQISGLGSSADVLMDTPGRTLQIRPTSEPVSQRYGIGRWYQVVAFKSSTQGWTRQALAAKILFIIRVSGPAVEYDVYYFTSHKSPPPETWIQRTQ